MLELRFFYEASNERHARFYDVVRSNTVNNGGAQGQKIKGIVEGKYI
jgi:hypothetical protein